MKKAEIECNDAKNGLAKFIVTAKKIVKTAALV